MLPRFDGQYLFILPLPVKAPGVNTVLGGVVYAITDAECNLIGKKGIIICKGPDYLLPSPKYLYALGIDPHNLRQGLCEFDFYHQVKQLIGNRNLDVITWSVRNLQALNALSLRIFDKPNALCSAHALIDVCKVLKAAAVFSEISAPCSDSLTACAKALGFNQDFKPGDNFVKLDALIYVVSVLNSQSPQLLNFFLRPQTAKIADYQKAIASGKYLADLDFKTGKVEMLLPLSCHEHLLDALILKGGRVSREYKLLNDAGLLAPAAIMTKERQLSLGINLRDAIQLLKEAKNLSTYEDCRKAPYWQSFFEHFNPHDLSALPLMQCNSPMSFTAPSLACSKFFKDRVFLCRGDNSLNAMLPQEQSLYYKTSASMLKRQLPSYLKEVAALSVLTKKDDEKSVKLLRAIERYPYDL